MYILFLRITLGIDRTLPFDLFTMNFGKLVKIMTTKLKNIKNSNFKKDKIRSNFNEQILKFRAEN